MILNPYILVLIPGNDILISPKNDFESNTIIFLNARRNNNLYFEFSNVIYKFILKINYPVLKLYNTISNAHYEILKSKNPVLNLYNTISKAHYEIV